MKSKKAMTNQTILLFLSIAVVLVVIFSIIPKLEEAIHWIDNKFGIGKGYCEETEQSFKDYNQRIERSVYMDGAVRTIPIILEFTDVCEFEVSDLVIKGYDAKTKSMELAEELCETRPDLAMEIYENIYSDEKGDKYESCFSLYNLMYNLDQFLGDESSINGAIARLQQLVLSVHLGHSTESCHFYFLVEEQLDGESISPIILDLNENLLMGNDLGYTDLHFQEEQYYNCTIISNNFQCIGFIPDEDSEEIKNIFKSRIICEE